MSARRETGTSGRGDEIERLLTEYLEQAGQDRGATFEEFCRRHPRHRRALEVRLRRLRRLEGWLEELKDGAASGPRIGDAAAGDRGSDAVTDFLSGLSQRVTGYERYRVQGELGRGGMGAVLRVWDGDLERPLALKRLHDRVDPAEVPWADRAARNDLERFLEEVRITARLDHPGVVPVHELGVDPEGRVYFTMKLIEGRTFERAIELVHGPDGDWTVTHALTLLVKACQAVAYAHDKGVVHRDLKPSNLMVGDYGEVYVNDWGLARARRPSMRPPPATVDQVTRGREPLPPDSDEVDEARLTQAGDVIGTPAYMPPEQARGQVDEVGPRSDVYSMGAILYHLMVGRPPYVRGSQRDSSAVIVARVLAGPPEPVSRVAPRAPSELVSICERAMARDPERRYGDMSALAEDLQAYLEGRVVKAYESGALAELRKWCRRNRGFAFAAACALLLTILGLLRIQGLQSNARQSRALARQSAEQLEIVAIAPELRDLRRRFAALWPAHPARAPLFESWLADAERILERAPRLAIRLSAARLRGREASPEELEQATADHPRHTELVEERRALDEIEDAIEGIEVGSLVVEDPQKVLRYLRRKAEEASGRVAELERAILSAVAWHFDDPADRRAFTIPHEIREDLEAFEAVELPRVRDGLRWALDLRARTLEAHADRWTEAVAEIAASPHYEGLRIVPQLGLIPLGPDPGSGLWEFLHLGSGAEPRRDASTGRWTLDETTGVVLVLIPGGSFWMGAQPDPQGPNYDSRAQGFEAPVQRVELEPYFLSKYELTQAQWRRLDWGGDPSAYRTSESDTWEGSEIGWTNPVENVSWTECDRVLRRAGLALPTEAQWERACRAGTDTPWWTGAERDSLVGAVNLADGSAAERGLTWPTIADWPELRDGFVIHAPVDRLLPNPFGLHNMHGNVWEWCQDVWGEYHWPVAQGDGRRQVPGYAFGTRVVRGGSYFDRAFLARSAYRWSDPPDVRDDSRGVRPARPLER